VQKKVFPQKVEVMLKEFTSYLTHTDHTIEGTVTDLINAMPGNGSVNMVQQATIE
jgi:hypothetical protein